MNFLLTSKTPNVSGVVIRISGGENGKCAIISDAEARGYDVRVRFVEGNLAKVAEKVLEYIAEEKGETKSTLVFTNTRDEAEFLGAVLKAKSPSIPVEVHQDIGRCLEHLLSCI